MKTTVADASVAAVLVSSARQAPGAFFASRAKRFIVAISAVLGCVPAAASVPPCATPGEECIEWVTSGNERLLAYRTFALDQRNQALRRALVVIHGVNRDADNYFGIATAAARRAGALTDTLIVALRFAANDGKGCRDALAGGEINWICAGPDNWRAGGAARMNAELTSFDLVDHLLRQFARRDLFPNLDAVVVAGHSAGGQFVSRYAMANRVHGTLGLHVSYVVANPSSYAYLDGSRQGQEGAANEPVCADYDDWPYGLRNRTGYASRLTDADLKAQFAARPVTYLLGEADTQARGHFDSSCAAMAQGPHRMARGLAFARYATSVYGAPHRFQVVPVCGHNARCMFTADAALGVLFSRPDQ